MKIKFIIVILALTLSIVNASITKGPYLSIPEENSITIMWESDNTELCKVSYWQNDEVNSVENIMHFDSQNGFFLYKAELNGLLPDQKYSYKIVMESDSSSESYFYTSTLKDQPFTFVALGDSRSHHKIFSTVLGMVDEISPKFIISMGDLVAQGREFDQWGPHYFAPSKSLINHIPHFSTLGDHETQGDYNGYNFYYYFRNGIDTDRMWFSYDYGGVHFVSLDYRGEFNEEMIEWFENDMNQSDSKWKIVYLHRPTYNLGGHRTNWGNPIWQKLYSKHKVDIVFTGHSHIYERFYPMSYVGSNEDWPVTYITTGGAGAGLYESVKNDYLKVTKSVNHLCVVSVTQDTLRVKALEIEGNKLDDFDIVKQNGKYSDSYLNLVKNQETMDIYMTFAKKLRLIFNDKLTLSNSIEQTISFNSVGIDIDVPFVLNLSEESSKYYSCNIIQGVLKKGEKFESTVKLSAKGEFKKKGKYFDPTVCFNVSFEYRGKKMIVYGDKSRYFPPKQ